MNILATLEAITISAGYAIPRDFRLITREVLDFPETQGRRPALIVAFVEASTEFIELGGTVQTILQGMASVHFDPEIGVLPATHANAYKTALRRALVLDRSRGGIAGVITTRIMSEAIPALWIKTTPHIVDVLFEVEYLHQDESA